MIRINITQTKGNSYNTYEEEDLLVPEWNDMRYAKESLKRIKSHNEFYNEYGDNYRKPTCELPEGVLWSDECRCLKLELVLDGGVLFQTSARWHGWFETLLKAEIISDDNDMIYEP